jgi:anti-sigma factor RsiW
VSAPDDDLAPDEAQLHAYLDGQLTPDQARLVENRLARDPEAALRVQEWRGMNQRLHALYDPTLEEPVPARLSTVPRFGWSRVLRAAAAAVVWLAVGTGLGWWWRGNQVPPRTAPVAILAERAALAHTVYVPEVRHPVEVPANQEAHLVAWLSKRLGEPIKAPKLAGEGYELVGGRLLPSGQDGPAAQFMYQEAGGGRITLYVKCMGSNTRRETAFRYDRAGSVGVFTWIDDRVAYSLAAELPREKHLVLAEAVYRQFNP